MYQICQHFSAYNVFSFHITIFENCFLKNRHSAILCLDKEVLIYPFFTEHSPFIPSFSFFLVLVTSETTLGRLKYYYRQSLGFTPQEAQAHLMCNTYRFCCHRVCVLGTRGRVSTALHPSPAAFHCCLCSPLLRCAISS